jgi:RNA polymerase sigma-70 factor (ECF subfamily)
LRVPSNFSVWPYKAVPLEDSRMSEGAVSPLEQKVTETFLELRIPVYRYVLGMVGDSREAEDLTQEAFLRLFLDLRKGQSVANARAWVFRVAHNLVVDRVRRHGDVDAVSVDDGDAEHEDPAPTAEQTILDRERQTKVSQALGRLSRQERNCVQLRRQGLRYREIAEVLAIRVPTVQTLLGRAVKKMVSAFE